MADKVDKMDKVDKVGSVFQKAFDEHDVPQSLRAIVKATAIGTTLAIAVLVDELNAEMAPCNLTGSQAFELIASVLRASVSDDPEPVNKVN
jgi:hypothetical protein